MYHSDKPYAGLGESDCWKLLLCGYYALRELEIKYSSNLQITKIKTGYLCGDKRRTSTVRKFLEGIKLVEEDYRTSENLTPIPEEVEKLLEGFSKEPRFNTSGYITKKASYSWEKDVHTTVMDLGQVYLNTSALNAFEIIHVYLHQNLYDFREFRHITHYQNRNRYTGKNSHIRYSLKIYPLSAIPSASNSSLIAAGESFAKSHATKILSEAFNLKFRAIDDKKPYTELEKISSRLSSVEEKLRLLHRTRLELLVLQRKAQELGDKDLNNLINDTGVKYIKRRAPLWINSTDKEERNLSMLACKGVNIITETESHN